MKLTGSHFRWLFAQARDQNTKIVIQQLEKQLGLAKNKDHLPSFDIAPKFPLSLGRWKVWLSEESLFYSIKAYIGIFREREHCRAADFPSEDDSVIVDIGANEGFYVLKAREMAPKARIIAIEPNPSAYQVLERNMKTNKLENVVIINKAVTSRTGTTSFEVMKGHASVGGLKVHARYRDKGQIEKIQVSSITLERLCRILKIKRINLLKLDVEGSELEIFESSNKILPNVEKVVVEYHDNSKFIKELMTKNHFTVVAMERKDYCGDIYFIRKTCCESQQVSNIL